MIFVEFLHKLTDGELEGLLKQYDERKGSTSEGEAKGSHEKKKVLVPKEGLVMKHIRTGEDVVMPRRLVAVFVLLTMVDFADQNYGWQVMYTVSIHHTGRDREVPFPVLVNFENFLQSTM